MASNDHQSHRTPRPGPAHRLADPEELDSGPDGLAGNQHGGDCGAGRDLPALHALGRADPVPGATGQPLPGFAQRSRRAGPSAAQPPALAAHPPAKTGNSWARRRSAPPPSNRRPRPEQLLLHLPARKSAMAQPVNRGALLQMHQGMMPGQPQGQPGRYRSSAVRVGRYYPPVPAWAHSRFESIHPGADGPGRPGSPWASPCRSPPLPPLTGRRPDPTKPGLARPRSPAGTGPRAAHRPVYTRPRPPPTLLSRADPLPSRAGPLSTSGSATCTGLRPPPAWTSPPGPRGNTPSSRPSRRPLPMRPRRLVGTPPIPPRNRPRSRRAARKPPRR